MEPVFVFKINRYHQLLQNREDNGLSIHQDNSSFKVYFLLLFQCAYAETGWRSVLDQPLLINLSRNKDRYEKTNQLLKNTGFTNIFRFEAIDGHNTSDQYFSALNITGGRPGEKGCAASHLLIWKEFAEDLSDEQYLFVCEDDVVPHANFIKIFPNYWKQVPKDFDVVMVGSMIKIPRNQLSLIVQIPTVTTHAYIISKKGSKKLFNLYMSSGGNRVIDLFLCKMMKNRSIIYYCFNGNPYPDPRLNDKNFKLSGSGICFQDRSMPSTIKGNG